MVGVTVNFKWKILHSMWTVLLEIEGRVLQWTICGRYCTAGGQWYCSLNGWGYSDHYVEGTAQIVDSFILGWMVGVTVNIMWKVLHRMRTVLLQIEWWVLQWTQIGRYCTACGQCYWRLNVVWYSEHYVEVTAQQVDRLIAGWMESVTVTNTWKVLHRKRTVVMQIEWRLLQWIQCERYCTAVWLWYYSLICVCYRE